MIHNLLKYTLLVSAALLLSSCQFKKTENQPQAIEETADQQNPDTLPSVQEEPKYTGFTIINGDCPEIQSITPTSLARFDTTVFYNNDTSMFFKYAYCIAIPEKGVSEAMDSIRNSMIRMATGYWTDNLRMATKRKFESMTREMNEAALGNKGSNPFSSSLHISKTCIYEHKICPVFENEDLYNVRYSSHKLNRVCEIASRVPQIKLNAFELWDLKKAKKITADDIFKSRHRGQLTRMIIDALSERYDDQINADDITICDNILISDSTLSFVYDLTTINPYAATFKYSDLKRYMKEESPLYKFVR